MPLDASAAELLLEMSYRSGSSCAVIFVVRAGLFRVSCVGAIVCVCTRCRRLLL